MDGFAPIYIPGPTDATGTVGNGGGSALAGSAIGTALTPILGPLGPIAGGLLGGLFGGGTPKGSNDGLQGALQTGLGSLFGSKSSSSAVQNVQTGQSTNVNVSNVLGGRPFGNYDETTGDFDTFQAISDIFAIKTAQDQARLAGVTDPAPAAAATTAKAINFMPLIVVGGLAAAFILMRRK